MLLALVICCCRPHHGNSSLKLHCEGLGGPAGLSRRLCLIWQQTGAAFRAAGLSRKVGEGFPGSSHGSAASERAGASRQHGGSVASEETARPLEG